MLLALCFAAFLAGLIAGFLLGVYGAFRYYYGRPSDADARTFIYLLEDGTARRKAFEEYTKGKK